MITVLFLVAGGFFLLLGLVVLIASVVWLPIDTHVIGIPRWPLLIVGGLLCLLGAALIAYGINQS